MDEVHRRAAVAVDLGGMPSSMQSNQRISTSV